jgi:hypothetical protein
MAIGRGEWVKLLGACFRARRSVTGAMGYYPVFF